MLTASQCRIVAYVMEGAIICPACARAQHGDLTVERADVGLYAGALSPLIEYEAGNYQQESDAEYAEQEGLGEDYSSPMLCECGAEILEA